jgi:hypothetical protein
VLEFQRHVVPGGAGCEAVELGTDLEDEAQPLVAAQRLLDGRPEYVLVSRFEQRGRHAVLEQAPNTLTTGAEGSSALTLDGGHRVPTERFAGGFIGHTSLC